MYSVQCTVSSHRSLYFVYCVVSDYFSVSSGRDSRLGGGAVQFGEEWKLEDWENLNFLSLLNLPHENN